MTYLFLDTEWADLEGTQLVSLALISDDEAHQFYAEITPLPAMPTDFVRTRVYPLLERGDRAMTEQELTAALHAFLSGITEPSVLADYPNDLVLLRYVLDGFGRNGNSSNGPNPVTKPIMTLMLKDGITQRVLEDWFRAHPDAAARRHHALVDAQALRNTWLALTDRLAAPWSPSLAKQKAIRL